MDDYKITVTRTSGEHAPLVVAVSELRDMPSVEEAIRHFVFGHLGELPRVIGIETVGMTRDEFERAFAKRSGVTVERLHDAGRWAKRCHCGGVDCYGWEMGHELSGYPEEPE